VSAAVQLDDEACGWPDAVHLHSFDEHVGLRERKTGIDEERLEELFEVTLQDGEPASCLFNDCLDDWDARLARVALELGRPATDDP
jgi:hypothetical protein